MKYENYVLSLDHLKALACIIPLIPNLKGVNFTNNNLSDEMVTLIFMATFQNPCIEQITVSENNIKYSASNTFKELLLACPDKLKSLNLQGSYGIGHHLDAMTTDMGLESELLGNRRPGIALSELNLSNIALSQTAAKNIGNILINSESLRVLDLQCCQMDKMATRSVIDGLNRNVGLHYFNFSHNDLSSNLYEFSIKIAKILSRHEEIMHLQLSNTGLTKEEVIFVGMTLPVSKSCIGLHLSANGLTYYDRVFLRTLINAKVNYHFRNFAAEKTIKSSNEKSVLSEHAASDFFDDDLKQFLKAFNFIENQRINLDEDISETLKDLDISKIFMDARQKTKAKDTEEEHTRHKSKSLINEIVDKLMVRSV